MMICDLCGLEKPDDEVKMGICDHCFKFGPPKKEAVEGLSNHELELRLQMGRMILTTSTDVPGRQIEKVLTIVAAEAALGMNIIWDIANSWHDILGGRATTSQNILKKAREECLDEIKREAAMTGADAIIAIDLDYNEISTRGNGGGILFVAATGTAVKLKPMES